MRSRCLIISAVAASLFFAAACSSATGVKSKEATTVTTTAETTPVTDSVVPEGPFEETTVPDTVTPAASALEWAGCDDPSATEEVLECATLAVPIDYEQPNGDTIDIAMVRVPSAGPREGAILFNPGGPGGSGFDFIAVNGTFVAQAMGLDGFDLIGFDPRGVDRSGGIRCIDDATQDKYLYLDSTPDTPEEQALIDESDDVFIEGCKAEYGDTLKHYSTANTARDMDAIRAALGDEQMSYLGISYGTYLGAVYATLFPDRVRAMVLDSAFEPAGDTIEEQYETQLVGFDGAFNNWKTWCEETPTCDFNAPDVGARWDALVEQLDNNPVEAEDGRLGNQSTMTRATTAALYSESQWSVLATALANAEAGDVAGIFAIADEYNGRSEDGTFETLFQSYQAITCASGIQSQTPPDPEALYQRLVELSPRFTRGLAADDLLSEAELCTELTGDVEQLELSYSGDGPIVVVGGKNDPATPFRWAEEMTAALGENAYLVTATGEGHGQLLANTCITDIEASLLNSLLTPERDAVCEPDPEIERPEFWDSLPTPDGVSDVVDLSVVQDLLGLAPTFAFSEVRTTELDSDAVREAYANAMDEAGLSSNGSEELGINGAVVDYYNTPDGDPVLVVVLSQEAFDTPDLEGAKTSVPSTGSVLLVVYIP
jgi:pimeloyl-ACP methyl ester carboxylesterase